MTEAPGPEDSQLMGTLARFKSDSLGLFTDLQQRYGGIVRVKLGPYLVHSLTDPDAIKHVLQDNPDNYRRGRFYQGFTLFMGRGMLTTDGAEWKKRKVLSQPFFQRAQVEKAAPIITDCVAGLLDRWTAHADEGEVIDVVDDLMWVSMGVLSRTLFGIDLRERAEELMPAVRFSLTAMIITGKLEQMLPRWIPTRYQRTLKRHQAVLNATMDHVVERHNAGHGDPDSLVGALLAATEPGTGQAWDSRAIRAELKTHFMAGHETTGCGLAWTLYSVADDPKVQAKLVAELDEVLAGDTPTVEHLPRLPYLRQVVEESLRQHPPIWAFPRGAVEDDEIGGHHIPADSSLLISPYAIHHNPETWDNHADFDPERFCPASPKPARNTYLPFGGGARRCIGHHLATLEIQLTVAMILQRYRLSTPPGHNIHPAGLVSLRPAGGLPLRVEHATRA